MSLILSNYFKFPITEHNGKKDWFHICITLKMLND